MHVLIAESNASATQSICEILESDERVASIVRVSDGAAAVAGAAQADVVVIDLSIKGLGSLGTIHGIGNLDNPPTVLAVDTTDDGWKDRAALLEGADEVFDWPDEASRLAERLSQLAGAKIHGEEPEAKRVIQE